MPTCSKPALSGYQITEELYNGSRTLVYRAVRQADQQSVVIKLLKNKTPSFSELVQFRNQYAIAKNLQIPGIIKTDSLELYGNGYALVMEDFGGESLRHFANDRSLPLEQFLSIALQLVDILHSLHQQHVIHKDIKPANILIQPETQQVKLIDFSISSLLPKETQEIKNPNGLEGTLTYLSPEQTGRMNRGIDYRSDFYSLGITFYELLTGQLPFQSTDPMELVHCHIAEVPRPVCTLNPTIPSGLSAIVQKLMAKNAEDRYQSALGLKHDLLTCWTQWQATGSLSEFTLGARDLCDRFLIPEKLYGREQDVETLLKTFGRVANGALELMLVSGFSGIGKTAVVNEVHKPIVRQRGYFIKGKYDQFNRDIPFSAVVHAFRDLMGQLLSENEDQLAQWKDKILAALGENGQVLIEVVPELEQIIGKQPAAPKLSGSAAQNRFNLLFQQFVRVFTTPEHPLVVFLDDLQWADSASLNLIQMLMSQHEVGYLLLIGAYRDNEVSLAHPLMLTIAEVEKAAIVSTLSLASLAQVDVNRLIADTLSCSVELALPLTELIYQKTQGNPFFTTQFFKSLHEDGSIAFDQEVGSWQCDVSQIRALSLTDDVVEFMVQQLQKLPAATQTVLKFAACMGVQFDLNTLAIVLEQSVTETAAMLWKGLQEGLVVPQSEVYKFYHNTHLSPQPSALNPQACAYKFLHDRVQQAAYSLIPQERKQLIHLQIGRLLLQATLTDEQDEQIFVIVNHLNQGASLIDNEPERRELVQLNLAAGQKARSSTAYGAALNYFNTGTSLLSSDCWQSQYDLALALHSGAAEAAYLNTDFEQVEQLVAIVLNQAQSWFDRVPVYVTKIQTCIAQVQLLEALQLAREVLAGLGVSLPEQPTQADVAQALEQTQELLGGRAIESLLELPVMTAADKEAAMVILSNIISVAYQVAPDLLPLIILAHVNLSVVYGNAPESTYGYVMYGLMQCSKLDAVELGYRFGQLGVNLLQRIHTPKLQAKTLFGFHNHLSHWKESAADTLSGYLHAYTSGLEAGDLEYVSLSLLSYGYTACFSGQELTALRQTMETHRKITHQFCQYGYFSLQTIYYQTVLNLLELSSEPDRLYSEHYDESVMIQRHLKSNQALALFQIYFCKLLLSYLFQRYEQALENAHLTHQYLDVAAGLLHVPLFYFYKALAQLAVYPDRNAADQAIILEQVDASLEKLTAWATHAPSNQAHRCALVAAERCRVLGKNAEASEYYDLAIASAKATSYVQDEALANELAAKFYLEWGKQRIAQEYLLEAYYSYACWGAKAKVVDLETRYPELLAPVLQQKHAPLSVNETVFASGTVTSIGSSSSTSDVLDLAVILKASQTLSSEIELDKLLASLLQLILENAGADKCVLLLRDGSPNAIAHNRLLVNGLATTGAEPTVLQQIPLEESQDIPLKLIYRVKNCLEPVVLMDANADTEFAADPYFLRQQPKSILCSPILHQGKLLGIVYLENNLTLGAFTNERVHVLNLLCFQASISLEHVWLYKQSQDYARELERSLEKLRASEARFQRMADNIPGVVYQFRWNSDGSTSTPFMSSGCTTLFEVSPENIMTGAIDFREMEHPDDRHKLEQVALQATQSLTPFEQEARIVTASGSVKWIQTVARPERQTDGSIVWDGLKIDITDRKQAQQQLQESQQVLQLVLDTIPHKVFWKDINLVYQGCNIAFAEDAGVSSPTGIVGKTDYDLAWKTEEADFFRECDRRVIELNTPELNIIEPQLQADGTEAWVETSKLPLHNANGNAIGILGIYQNITDRQLAEAELQQALEEREYQTCLLQTVLDSTQAWIFAKDRNFRYIMANRSYAEAIGQTVEAMLGKDDLELGFPEELVLGHPEKNIQGFRTDDRRALAGEIVHNSYDPATIADGSLRIFDTRKNPLYDSNGTIFAMLGFCNDVTDLKQAEATLAKEREFLNAIIHNITDGIVVCDASGHLSLFNKATCEFHGLPVESLPPEQWAEHFDLYQPDGKTPLPKTEIPLFRAWQGEIVENAEMIIAPKQGSTRFLLASGQAIFDPSGNKIGAVVAMRDISDRKQAEQALQQKSQALETALADLQYAQIQIVQSEKMSALGNLVAGVAHEINNPIGFIAGNLQPALDYIKDTFGLLDLYQQEYPNPSRVIQEEIEAIDLDYMREDLPKLIGSMKLGVDRIRGISTSLRTFSRADKDYKVLFNIHEGIDSTILILKHRLKANEFRPEIKVYKNYGNIPAIECFPGQLNQVFMNILANAIDAVEEGNRERSLADIKANSNRIDIQTQLNKSQEQVIIQIRDNGVGMSNEILHRVFDHLFTTKAVGKGTGLGLAIAHQMVEKHSGAISVNSTVGVGTEFVITLPVKANGSV